MAVPRGHSSYIGLQKCANYKIMPLKSFLSWVRPFTYAASSSAIFWSEPLLHRRFRKGATPNWAFA